MVVIIEVVLYMLVYNIDHILMLQVIKDLFFRIFLFGEHGCRKVLLFLAELCIGTTVDH